MRFKSRNDAGIKLASHLKSCVGDASAVVLGLIRGGVVVAAEAARILEIPLDVVGVRKIGAPFNPELALGAIGEYGEGVFNESLLSLYRLCPADLKIQVADQKRVLLEKLSRYRNRREAVELKGKCAILVDDGIATGASMKAAIASVRSRHPAKIILAVPVAAPDSLSELRSLVDQTICLHSPSDFEAVGAYYDEFSQTSDEEVIALLSSSRRG